MAIVLKFFGDLIDPSLVHEVLAHDKYCREQKENEDKSAYEEKMGREKVVIHFKGDREPLVRYCGSYEEAAAGRDAVISQLKELGYLDS